MDFFHILLNELVINPFSQLLSSSSNILSYPDILGNELDFGTASTTVAGAIFHTSGRTVTWYLMTKREVPSQCNCHTNCLTAKTTSNGYVVFNNDIKLNTLLYICAFSNSTVLQRELFTENLEEISSCSDGFVLDDKPPVPGNIYVGNNSGFITDTRNILLSWDAFKSSVDVTTLGYDDEIKSYSFAIGIHHFNSKSYH